MIIVRWSMTSFIGIERTLVAVGMLSEESIFFAVRIGAPRRTWYFAAWSVGSGRTVGFGASADNPPDVPGTAGDSLLFEAGRVVVAFCSGAGGALLAVSGLVGAAGAGFGADVAVAGCGAAGLASGVLVAAECLSKYSLQLGVTEFGSAWYASYISSMSHELAPKSSSGPGDMFSVVEATFAFFRCSGTNGNCSVYMSDATGKSGVR